MLYISHRGNLEGVNKKDENRPDYIVNAINKSFDVEVDIWFEKNTFFLGHDNPDYPIGIDFIKKKKIMVSCKKY